ncbi:MAG: rhodanese-like domain-containing protein [Calditrichia bacterium]
MNNKLFRRSIEILILLLTIGFFATAGWLAVHKQAKVPAIMARDFETWITRNSPVIIDLREGPEAARRPLNYDAVIHLPFLFLMNRLNEINLPGDYKLLFVCSDGNRARLIANLLGEKGVSSYYLKDGLEAVKIGKYLRIAS